MHQPIVLDAAGPALLVGGLLFFLVGIAIVVVVEAGVLAMMRWASFGSSLLDSLVMNVVSLLAGIGLAIGLGTLVERQNGAIELDLPDVAAYALFIALALLVSVVVEALVLLLVRRRGARTWTAVLVANLASYAIVVGLIVGLSLA